MEGLNVKLHPTGGKLWTLHLKGIFLISLDVHYQNYCQMVLQKEMRKVLRSLNKRSKQVKNIVQPLV